MNTAGLDDLFQPHSQTFREIAADATQTEEALRSALECAALYLAAAVARADQAEASLASLAAVVDRQQEALKDAGEEITYAIGELLKRDYDDADQAIKAAWRIIYAALSRSVPEGEPS